MEYEVNFNIIQVLGKRWTMIVNRYQKETNLYNFILFIQIICFERFFFKVSLHCYRSKNR